MPPTEGRPVLEDGKGEDSHDVPQESHEDPSQNPLTPNREDKEEVLIDDIGPD